MDFHRSLWSKSKGKHALIACDKIPTKAHIRGESCFGSVCEHMRWARNGWLSWTQTQEAETDGIGPACFCCKVSWVLHTGAPWCSRYPGKSSWLTQLPWDLCVLECHMVVYWETRNTITKLVVATENIFLCLARHKTRRRAPKIPLMLWINLKDSFSCLSGLLTPFLCVYVVCLRGDGRDWGRVMVAVHRDQRPSVLFNFMSMFWGQVSTDPGTRHSQTGCTVCSQHPLVFAFYAGVMAGPRLCTWICMWAPWFVTQSFLL